MKKTKKYLRPNLKIILLLQIWTLNTYGKWEGNVLSSPTTYRMKQTIKHWIFQLEGYCCCPPPAAIGFVAWYWKYKTVKAPAPATVLIWS